MLDEATSALDPKSERLVQDALDRISTDRTTLVIAHKLATIRKADNIAVISDGTVVEQGSHETLTALDGRYAKLVAAQDLGKADDQEKSGQPDTPALIKRQTTASAYHVGGITEDSMQSEKPALGYSLVKCVWILLTEQKSLFPCFFVAVFACLIGGATYPGQAVLYSRILTVFTLPPDEAQRQVNFYALMFFVVALGNLLAYSLVGWTANWIAQQLSRSYRSEMFGNILKQDVEFFDRPENTSGALTARVTSIPASLNDLISFNLLIIVIVMVNVVSTSVLILVYGWKLGLVIVLGGFPLLLMAGYTRIQLETKFDKSNGERFSESASLASESILAIRTVSSLTLEPLIIKKYSDILDGIAKKTVRSLKWTILLYAFSQSVEFLIMALGFWYGSRLVSRGEYTINQFYVIFIGFVFAAQAAAQFFSFTASKLSPLILQVMHPDLSSPFKSYRCG